MRTVYIEPQTYFTLILGLQTAVPSRGDYELYNVSATDGIPKRDEMHTPVCNSFCNMTSLSPNEPINESLSLNMGLFSYTGFYNLFCSVFIMEKRIY